LKRFWETATIRDPKTEKRWVYRPMLSAPLSEFDSINPRTACCFVSSRIFSRKLLIASEGPRINPMFIVVPDESLGLSDHLASHA
jgi:hypothetical protein